MINKIKADAISAQAINEINEARTYKQSKISGWQDNEALYYGKKLITTESRANVSLGRMQEFVHTLLSKIDNPLLFKFYKRKPSQSKRVELLNSLRRYDAEVGFWDLKDIVGKKQCIIYGRAIYAYYASSIDGYESNLEPVDVYDFLVDPATSGIDLDTAMYMGRWGVVKTVKQLKDGVKARIYQVDAVKRLIDSGGNNSDSPQEENNKRQRTYDNDLIGNKEKINSNKYKFWEWFTTYDGERYYVLMTNGGEWIRCEKLVDMFSNDKFPFWSYASFPDLTEFWTPSYCDYARELLLTQDIAINQMLDNAEAINKPMRIVVVGDLEDPTKLKYRKDGVVPVKKGVDINKTYQTISVPSIDTPIQVFQILESIQEKASGVTANTKGVADEEGKVGIYEGNMQAEADRFGLFNKSYSFGYKRFAELYQCGVKDHLNKRKAIEIVGPNGVEVKEVSKRDIYKDGDEYSISTEASNAELMASAKDRQAKLAFLSAQINNPLVNKNKAFEMSALISGLTEEEIRQLLDTSVYGNEDLMSEADRDIERILFGEIIEPNENANNAYKQRMVDYLKDHKENITNDQFFEISAYIDALQPIIYKNEARNLMQSEIDQLKANNTPPPAEVDITQQNYEI